MSQATFTPASLPPDVANFVAELDRVDGQARELARGLSDEQMNWQESPGRTWSIAQCLDHLAKTNEQLVPKLRDAVQLVKTAPTGPRAPIGPGGLFDSLFLKVLEPPPRFRVKAASEIAPQANTGTRALTHFLTAQQLVRAFTLETASFDLSRARMPHPATKRFTVGAGMTLMVIAAHNRRHLWQASRVRSGERFPKT